MISVARFCCKAILCFCVFAPFFLASAQTDAAKENSGARADFSAAQKLVYFTRHLANVKSPTTLIYSLSGHSLNGVNFRNNIALEVFKIWPSGARGTKFFFPSTGAPNSEMEHVREEYCCNPIIFGFFEWDTQKTYSEIGVSRFYVRRRLRDALADVKLEDAEVVIGGKKVKARSIRFKPFSGEEARRIASLLTNREYRLTFVDTLPGMLFSIEISSPADKEKNLPSENLKLVFSEEKNN